MKLREELRQWSPAIWLLELGLTTLVTTVVGYVFQMPLPILFIVFLSSTVVVASGIVLVRQARRDAIARTDRRKQDRLSRVLSHIARLESSIPVPKESQGLAKTLGMTVRPFGSPATDAILYGQDRRDWKMETKAAIRAMLKPELASEYDKCLRTKEPELSARAFLAGLRTSISISDLRTESERL